MDNLVTEIVIEKRKMRAEGKEVKYLVITSQTHAELSEILAQEESGKIFVPRHIRMNRLREFNELTIVEVEGLLYRKFMLGV